MNPRFDLLEFTPRTKAKWGFRLASGSLTIADINQELNAYLGMERGESYFVQYSADFEECIVGAIRFNRSYENLVPKWATVYVNDESVASLLRLRSAFHADLKQRRQW